MKINVTIKGITPIIMNRFTEENEVSVGSGTSAVQIGDKGTPRQQAEKKRYADKEGNLYIPGPNIFACLINAGKFHKVGKSKVTTQKSSLIPAGITVEEIVVPMTNGNGGKPAWEVDSRSVVIPSTGGRIMCHRPRVDEWRAQFTLDVDTEMFQPNFVRKLMDDAGKKVGLCDYRPERKGPFGRFVVTGWEEE
ncbi:MAG: hypothetical protein QME78_00295 [Thermodesulfobacteriota bacterium]|nr:hypothetical protein [Thermodesulfobacteriota bacterium]